MLKTQTINEIVEIQKQMYLDTDCVSLVHSGQIQMMKYSVCNENTYIRYMSFKQGPSLVLDCIL